MAHSSEVLDEGSDFRGSSEQTERLVDKMRTKVKGQAGGRKRLILPGSFQSLAVSVEAAVVQSISCCQAFINVTYCDSNSVMAPNDWEDVSG